MTDHNDVGRFHEKFGLDQTFSNLAGPRGWNPALIAYRIKFMQEELQEFIDAVTYDGVFEDETSIKDAIDVTLEDHAQAFDALIDLNYVSHGTAHFLGYPWVSGWSLVQRANMAKERGKADGSNSKRGSGFDVIKPEGWTAPDIEGLLVQYGW